MNYRFFTSLYWFSQKQCLFQRILLVHALHQRDNVDNIGQRTKHLFHRKSDNRDALRIMKGWMFYYQEAALDKIE